MATHSICSPEHARGRGASCALWLLTAHVGSIKFAEQLTNSGFPCGDVEKRPPVTVAGAQGRRPKPSAETNGETENAQNVGQLGSCGGSDAVNELRGNRCGERNWLPSLDTFRTLAAQNVIRSNHHNRLITNAI